MCLAYTMFNKKVMLQQLYSIKYFMYYMISAKSRHQQLMNMNMREFWVSIRQDIKLIADFNRNSWSIVHLGDFFVNRAKSVSRVAICEFNICLQWKKKMEFPYIIFYCSIRLIKTIHDLCWNVQFFPQTSITLEFD